MFNLAKIALIASALSLPSVFADIIPTSPDGNTVIKVGDNIKALWTEDTTGSWTDTEIQLMTGDNLNMVPLAVLATGIDGTSTSGLDIACPDVTPYSKIYFLQFTKAGDVSTSTWTTRFTIAGADGSSTEPTNSTTYSGTAVQWGTGALVGSAPTVITGSTASNSSSSGTSSSSSSGSSAAGAAASVSTISVPAASSSASSSASDAVVAAAASSSSTTSASASSSSGSSASPSPSTGAALRKSTVGLGAIVLGLAGLVAL